MKKVKLFLVSFFLLTAYCCNAQMDTSKPMRHYKNVIRYNLSGALLFGLDKYVVFGYERVISPHQSISINVGTASLPKLVSINTDSFSINKDRKRRLTNFKRCFLITLLKRKGARKIRSFLRPVF